MIRMISEGLGNSKSASAVDAYGPVIGPVISRIRGVAGELDEWRGIVIHGVMQGHRCTIVPNHFPLEGIYDTRV
jgi:hypothetical protein